MFSVSWQEVRGPLELSHRVSENLFWCEFKIVGVGAGVRRLFFSEFTRIRHRGPAPRGLVGGYVCV